MAYETEKTRLLQLLTQATGVNRTLNTDLARVAEERAFEAYQEVGIGPQPDGSYKGISHPTQMERESRLGPQWAGKGVAEIAIWFYFVNDPIKYAADGFMNSTPHRNVLIDPRFKHWGAGIYTHLPAGEPEYMRRWYIIVWLSVNIPVAPEPTPVQEGPTTLPAVKNFKADCGTFQINPGVNLRTEANLNSSTVIRATASGSIEKITAIGTTEGVLWNGSNRWFVGWMAHPNRGSMWTFVHSTLVRRV
jgi:hypothetical protein